MHKITRFFIKFLVASIFVRSSLARKNKRKSFLVTPHNMRNRNNLSFVIADEENKYLKKEQSFRLFGIMRRMKGKKHNKMSGGDGNNNYSSEHGDGNSNEGSSTASTTSNNEENDNSSEVNSSVSNGDDFQGYNDDDSNNEDDSFDPTTGSNYNADDIYYNQNGSGGGSASTASSYNNDNSNSAYYDESYGNDKSEYAAFDPSVSSKIKIPIAFKKGAWFSLIAAAVIILCIAGIAFYKKVQNNSVLQEKRHPLTGTVQKRMIMFSSLTSDLQEPKNVIQKDSNEELFVRI